MAAESTLQPPPPPRPARVRYELEAAARGFLDREGRVSPLAFRRWCRRHGVELLRDEGFLWVRPADVDRALDALEAARASEPPPPPPPPQEPLPPPTPEARRAATVSSIVAKVTGAGKGTVR